MVVLALFSAAASFFPQAHLSHLQSAFFAWAVHPQDSHLQAACFPHFEGHCAIAEETTMAAIANTLNTVFIFLILSPALQTSV